MSWCADPALGTIRITYVDSSLISGNRTPTKSQKVSLLTAAGGVPGPNSERERNGGRSGRHC